MYILFTFVFSIFSMPRLEINLSQTTISVNFHDQTHLSMTNNFFAVFENYFKGNSTHIVLVFGTDFFNSSHMHIEKNKILLCEILISLKNQITIYFDLIIILLLSIGVCVKFPTTNLRDYHDEETETLSKIDVASSILRVVGTFQPYFLTHVSFDVFKTKKIPNATPASDHAMPGKVFLLFIRRRKGK